MRPSDRNDRLVQSRIFLLCCSAGFLSVFAAFVVHVIVALFDGASRVRAENTFVALLFGLAASTIPSTITFLPVWFLLRKKQIEQGRSRLLAVPFFSTLGFSFVGFAPGVVFGGHAALVLTAAWLHIVLPNAFKGEGVCQGCGYDLTGNVSGRCSECGAAIEENEEFERPRHST